MYVGKSAAGRGLQRARGVSKRRANSEKIQIQRYLSRSRLATPVPYTVPEGASQNAAPANLYVERVAHT